MSDNTRAQQCARLLAHFGPQVHTELAIAGLSASDYALAVNHVEPMRNGGERFDLVVKLPPLLPMNDLLDLVKALKHFCGNNDLPWVFDGLYYTLGDGDDWQAVHLNDGALHIWLRGWRHG